MCLRNLKKKKKRAECWRREKSIEVNGRGIWIFVKKKKKCVKPGKSQRRKLRQVIPGAQIPPLGRAQESAANSDVDSQLP